MTSRFFSRMKLNRSDVIAVFCTAAGILVSYLLYSASLQRTSLSFLDPGVHPRLVNMTAVGASSITLARSDGSKVLTDVYLARLYFWNSGNVTIGHSAIRRSLAIVASGAVEILDSRYAMLPRPDVTGLSVSKASEKSLGVDFQVLEPGDGCTLNVIYASEKPVRFNLEGVVTDVHSFIPSDAVPPAVLGAKIGMLMLKIIGVLVGIGMGAGLLGWLSGLAGKKAESAGYARAVKGLQTVVVFAIGGGVAFVLYSAAKQQILNDPASFVPASLMPEPQLSSGHTGKSPS